MLTHIGSHCRTFHRLLSRSALLYTEMCSLLVNNTWDVVLPLTLQHRYTTSHLLHGDTKAILAFDRQAQGAVVAQLGGCDPRQLAACARACEEAGYSKVNLNCGCPSEATQKGSFGAVLMRNPSLVATCVRAMSDACSIPVTVKHRLGLGYTEDYSFVRDFVGKVSDSGARVIVAHARNAILGGLSPRQNRRWDDRRLQLHCSRI
jgi:tRNA-dihydrouridine synthase A